MKGRLIAAVALSLALAPACRMQEQKPNPNLNKAPIVETIRDAGVKMTDEGKDKLKGLVPAKAQPEQKAAEQADAETGKKSLREFIKSLELDKLELSPICPRGKPLEEIKKERARSTQ